MRKTSIFGQKGKFWTVFGQNWQNGNFLQQARGARSLGKFPKYRNKKKSGKKFFTQKEIFQE